MEISNYNLKFCLPGVTLWACSLSPVAFQMCFFSSMLQRWVNGYSLPLTDGKFDVRLFANVQGDQLVEEP